MVLPADDPRLSDYLDMVRRRWRTVAAVTAAVLVVAVLASLGSPPPTRAKALLSLSTSLQETPPAVQLEIAVLGGAEVRAAAEARLGRAPQVDVAAVGDTGLLSIEAAAQDPERAAEDANGYAAAYVEVRNARELRTLLAGQESVQARIDELALPAAGTAGGVDQETLRSLRLAADLLEQAAQSGRLAAVEAAAAQVADAAGGADAGRALTLVRQATLQQLLDELAVAVGQVRAAGPQVVVPASAADTTGQRSFARVLPLALVVGLLLGAATALLRELRDRRVRHGSDLEVRGVRAPVLPWTSAAQDEHDALRAKLLLARREGAVQIVAAREGDALDVAVSLRDALLRAGRDVELVAAYDADEVPDGVRRASVGVTHPDFPSLLADAAAPGRLVLVVSPSAEHADAVFLASVVDAAVLVVRAGVDDGGRAAATAAALDGSRSGLVAVVLVTPAGVSAR